MNKKTKDVQAKLTAKVKDSFKNFNLLTPEEQSMISQTQRYFKFQ
jgi:hypothetical protein